VNDLLQVILLGIIEGITEFLPISSTGHLLIAEHWLGQRSDVFNVVIQAGAILAVTLIYWQRLWTLATGLNKPENRDYAFKLGVAFLITAVLGLIVTKLGFKLPTELSPIAWALLIGGFWMLGAEWFAAKRPDHESITWKVAIVVGLAQIVAAIFPGTSRSAATIFAAMLIGGSSRVAATEFAFLVGIPTMYAASGYELLKNLRHPAAAPENWSDLAIGFVVSAVVAFIAVKWLLRYIQTHRFTAFAWYRIALGAALLVAVH
jgi:undecaprenyl-diphosphatase